MTWVERESVDAAVRVVTAILGESETTADLAIFTVRGVLLEVDSEDLVLGLGNFVAACLEILANDTASTPTAMLQILAASVQADQ